MVVYGQSTTTRTPGVGSRVAEKETEGNERLANVDLAEYMRKADSEVCVKTLLRIERAEHKKTRKMYEKADHDRKRYKKRLDFVEAQRAMLSDEFRRMKKLNETLEFCVSTLERRLMCEQGSAEETGEGAAGSSGVCEDDEGGTASRACPKRNNAGGLGAGV